MRNKSYFVKCIFFVGIIFCSSLRAEVYDCFTFFNELELLKVRLEELDPVVDHFVLVEARKSFTGNDKCLYFHENRKDFAKFKDKIIHLVIEEFPPPSGDQDADHWNRESYSRNYILNALKNCSEDDVIFISDLDEIPKSSTVTKIAAYLEHKARRIPLQNRSPKDFVCDTEMRLFSLSLNREYSTPWYGGCKAAPYWFFKHNSPWELKVFHHTYPNIKRFMNAGWHFNGMGGDQRVLEKWKNTAPISGFEEMLKRMSEDEEYLHSTVQSHRDAYTHTVKIDDSYPIYILKNIEYFRSLGWIWGEE